uniref:ARAD1B04796p n=1 Tax=Blastobotrys adeninivorans TaxID=409370 RepID=A0A060T546_BLAAD
MSPWVRLPARRLVAPRALSAVRVAALGQKRTIVTPPVGLPFDPPEEEENDKKPKGKGDKEGRFGDIAYKSFETAGIMVASLAMLGLAGLTYHELYQYRAKSKMEAAFVEPDPAFQLTLHKRHNRVPDSDEDYTGEEDDGWVVRKHQELLDNIIGGRIVGRYYLLIGEKGTGKTSMLLEAMRKVKGSHCSMMEAHADPEIFRIRLGKALNFRFFEDYLGALFSIRGPRDTTALLDIERAFDKLEDVAAEHFKKHQRPLVLIINNAHLIRDDDEGQHLTELLQQKAESLSGTGLVTLIFNSDDYWFYERLKKLGTRLDVISIQDLGRDQAIQALQRARRKYNGENLSQSVASRVYDLIGGRPQHIAAVMSKPDIFEACHQLIDKEKTWFLNQCGLLGEGMDDDVMESGKFSTSAMFLVRELTKIDRELRLKQKPSTLLTESDHELPRVPLWRARQIMTRPDYIQQYDNLNIFTIDSHSMVKADSVPMMQAFHEIASEPGFDELVEETADRVSAIESLGRTRELVAKDLVLNGRYKVAIEDTNDKKSRELVVRLDQTPEDEPEEGELDDGFNWLEKERSKWWAYRLKKYGHHKEKEENSDKSEEKNN